MPKQIYAKHRSGFWHPKFDLDIEFWDVKQPIHPSSQVDKYLMISNMALSLLLFFGDANF